ncbi:Probable trehalose-phosphate phosphatase H [Striga hermonthica]|uniref:Probable trehalose-phosphate phosphatase H n=1 Tax=Striga hermonthica TaxID=68872 RepID=A0A9N7R4C0_STRHE|nr:Probable trehalose-phosphate phosphatase H [Striga hermonthica]
MAVRRIPLLTPIARPITRGPTLDPSGRYILGRAPSLVDARVKVRPFGPVDPRSRSGVDTEIYGPRTEEPSCPENDSSVTADEQPNGLNLADTRYISWLNDHPSAIASFNGMMNAAKGKQIVVFLDYDGTLSPIVNDPDRAFMSDPMRSAVREVARYFPTAIISGRSREKVYEFVKLDEVFYAGSHGMDIKGPPSNVKSCIYGEYQINTQDDKGNESTIFQPAKEYLPLIKKVSTKL